MEDSRKPLTAEEIEEINALAGNHYTTWESNDKEAAATYLLRLLSLLTPPPDAAVKAAVERLSRFDYRWGRDLGTTAVRVDDLHILLRAVQAPRLNEEQMEAVQVAASLLKGKNGDRAWSRRKLTAAFPEAFVGEVDREGL